MEEDRTTWILKTVSVISLLLLLIGLSISLVSAADFFSLPTMKGISLNYTANSGEKFELHNDKAMDVYDKKGKEVFEITSTADIKQVGDMRVSKEWGYTSAGLETIESKYPLFHRENYLCVDNPEITQQRTGNQWQATKKKYTCIFYPNNANRTGFSIDKWGVAYVSFNGTYDPTISYIVDTDACTDMTCNNVLEDGGAIHLQFNDTMLFGWNFEGGVKGWGSTAFDGTWSGSDYNTTARGALAARIAGTYEISFEPSVYDAGTYYWTILTRWISENDANSIQYLIYGEDSQGIIYYKNDGSASSVQWGDGSGTTYESGNTGTFDENEEWCSGVSGYSGLNNFIHWEKENTSSTATQTDTDTIGLRFLQYDDSDAHARIGGRDDSHPDRAFYGTIDSIVLVNRPMSLVEVAAMCEQKYMGWMETNGSININFTGGQNSNTINVSYETGDTDSEATVCFTVADEASSPWRCSNTDWINLTAGHDDINITFILNTTNSSKTPMLYNVTVDFWNGTAAGYSNSQPVSEIYYPIDGENYTNTTWMNFSLYGSDNYNSTLHTKLFINGSVNVTNNTFTNNTYWTYNATMGYGQYWAIFQVCDTDATPLCTNSSNITYYLVDGTPTPYNNTAPNSTIFYPAVGGNYTRTWMNFSLYGHDNYNATLSTKLFINGSVNVTNNTFTNASTWTYNATMGYGYYWAIWEVCDTDSTPLCTNSTNTTYYLWDDSCTPNPQNNTGSWETIGICGDNSTVLQRRITTEYDANFCPSSIQDFNVTQSRVDIGTETGSHDLVNELNGSVWEIREVNGAVGFNFSFNFTGVTTDVTHMHFYLQYLGNPAHIVYGQMQNNTGSWVTFDTIPATAGFEWMNYTFNDTNYRQNNTVQMRFVHTSTGNQNHYFYIDHADLVTSGNKTYYEYQYVSCNDAPTSTISYPANKTEANQTWMNLSLYGSDDKNATLNTTLFINGSTNITNMSFTNSTDWVVNISFGWGNWSAAWQVCDNHSTPLCTNYSIWFYLTNTTTTAELTADEVDTLNTIIILPMILGLIFVIGAASMGKDHEILKIFLFLLSGVTFFASGSLAVTSGVMPDAMIDTIGIATYALGIIWGVIVTYYIIYLFVKMTHAAAQKKKEKLEY